MKRAELTKLLNKATEDFFVENNFKPYSYGQYNGWVKTDNNNLLFIDYGYLVHSYPGSPSTYTLEPKMIISNLEIENHYKKITSSNHKTFPIDFRTVSVNICNIEHHKTGIFTDSHFNYNWEINNVEDIQKIAPLLIDKYKEVALPCYNKLASTSNIDLLYNDLTTLEEPLIYPVFIPNRAIKGILAAKLVENKNIDFLIEYWSKDITTWPEVFAKNFENLVEYVKGNHF